jgi:hypothetical protein
LHLRQIIINASQAPSQQAIFILEETKIRPTGVFGVKVPKAYVHKAQWHIQISFIDYKDKPLLVIPIEMILRNS